MPQCNVITQYTLNFWFCIDHRIVRLIAFITSLFTRAKIDTAREFTDDQQINARQYLVFQRTGTDELIM